MQMAPVKASPVRDLSIREILTGIAEESGNACWIVRLKPGTKFIIGDENEA
jgi:hypothetical protein